MLDGAQWVTARITAARKLHASVTEGVSARMAQLLTGPLTERQLSPTELAKIASALITDMVPVLPTAKTKQ